MNLFKTEKGYITNPRSSVCWKADLNFVNLATTIQKCKRYSLKNGKGGFKEFGLKFKGGRGNNYSRSITKKIV